MSKVMFHEKNLDFDLVSPEDALPFAYVSKRDKLTMSKILPQTQKLWIHETVPVSTGVL